MLRPLSTELRSAIRRLSLDPVSTVVVVVSLTLGIGLNVATFGLWNAVFYKSLPGLERGNLLALYQTEKGQPVGSISFPDYLVFRDGSQVFEDIAAFRLNPSAMSLGLEGRPEVVQARMVTANFFSVLGLQPVRGRFFDPTDSTTASDGRVAVLSGRLWRNRWGRDDSVIDRDIRLNGETFTIIGVAPAAFQGATFGERIDVWLPIATEERNLNGTDLLERRQPYFSAIGCLAPGADMREAQASMDVLAARIERDHPKTNRDKGIRLHPPGVPPFAEATSLLGLLIAATMVVLLLACVNLAGLFYARSFRRRSEMALRAAFGATRWRLVRLLLVEGACMGVPAGLLAFLTSYWTTPLFIRFSPPSSAELAVDLSPDWRVLLFALLISLLCTGLFVVVPALRASRPQLAQTVATMVRGRGSGQSGLLSVLAGIQAAVSLPLLALACLLFVSLTNARGVDMGYRTEGLYFGTINLSLEGRSADVGLSFYSRLCENLAKQSPDASAAAARWLPLQQGRWGGRAFQPGEAEDSRGAFVLYNSVSPSFFRTLSIPLLSGRYLAQRDSAEAPRVAVVNAMAARTLWGDEDPLGKVLQFSYSGQRGATTQVVGVVGDIVNRQMERRPEVYFPFAQVYEQPATVLLRTSLPSQQAAEVLRSAVADLDPTLPFFRMGTIATYLDQTLWQQRMTGMAVSIFGALGLLLTLLGVYGLSSLAVSSRLSEFGLRLTLGASRGQVWTLVLKRNAAVGFAGVFAGVLLALVSTSVASSLLIGIHPRDPLVLTVVAIFIFLLVLVAGIHPGLRATKVDPASLLRAE